MCFVGVSVFSPGLLGWESITDMFMSRVCQTPFGNSAQGPPVIPGGSRGSVGGWGVGGLGVGVLGCWGVGGLGVGFAHFEIPFFWDWPDRLGGSGVLPVIRNGGRSFGRTNYQPLVGFLISLCLRVGFLCLVLFICV